MLKINPATSFVAFVSKCSRHFFGETIVYCLELNKLRSRVKKWAFLFLIFLGFITLLGGCARPPKEVPKPALKQPPSPEKLEELVVPLMEERKGPERLISFSLRDTDIRKALLAFSKSIGYNIVLDPDVSGRATVEVKRVPPMEALDALLTPLGLQYKIEKHFIRISRLRRETRVSRSITSPPGGQALAPSLPTSL